jgi:hypothetical protein
MTQSRSLRAVLDAFLIFRIIFSGVRRFVYVSSKKISDFLKKVLEV